MNTITNIKIDFGAIIFIIIILILFFKHIIGLEWFLLYLILLYKI